MSSDFRPTATGDGYSAEEALGAPLEMLVPPELREATAARLARAHAGEAVSQVDTQRLAKDGRRIDVSISTAPVRDERGAIIGAAALTRDITRRVLVEERLRTSEAQLAEAQELAGLGSFEYDVIENSGTWSAELYRVMGLDPEQRGDARARSAYEVPALPVRRVPLRPEAKPDPGVAARRRGSSLRSRRLLAAGRHVVLSGER